jgi:hypothetical protein
MWNIPAGFCRYLRRTKKAANRSQARQAILVLRHACVVACQALESQPWPDGSVPVIALSLTKANGSAAAEFGTGFARPCPYRCRRPHRPGWLWSAWRNPLNPITTSETDS